MLLTADRRKSRVASGQRRPPRGAVRLLARERRTPAAGRREHPEALSALHARQLHGLQRVAGEGGRSGSPRRGCVPRGESRAVARGTARRRQDASRRRGAEAGHPDDRRARPLLRHARSAARHPQHLRPVDPHHRARGPAAGDAGRPARARRSGRRENVGMGRGDDEPDRQHALQREAADDLHVELPGHPRRHGAELAAVPHRPPDAVAAARDVRSSSSSTPPTTASCRPTAASTT